MGRRIMNSAAGLMVLAIVAVVSMWLLRPHPRINEESFNAIQVGMTEQEVVAIIGAPAGNYGLGRAEEGDVFAVAAIMLELDHSTGPKKDWFGPEKGIRIGSDLEGKVMTKRLYGVWREYDSPLDMVCVWCRLKAPKPRGFVDID